MLIELPLGKIGFIENKIQKNKPDKIMTISRRALSIHFIDFFLITLACLIYYLSIDYIGSKITLSSFRGDASYYYVKITKGEWNDIYPFEPLLGAICFPYNNLDFTEYLIVSNLPLFALSIISAKMLGVSGIRLVSVMVLLSFSYFGLHLLFNFQRQFISLSLLLFGMAVAGKLRLLSLALSPMGHIWAVVPAILIWVEPFLKKKIVKTIIVALLLILLIALSILGGSEFSTKAATYSAYGDEDPMRLIIRSGVQLGFIGSLVFISGGFKRLEKRLKNQLIAYMIIMTISAVAPTISALFVRFDYYFYPILIIRIFVYLGRTDIKIWRPIVASVFVLAYSVASGIQWVNSISSWIFYGIMY